MPFTLRSSPSSKKPVYGSADPQQPLRVCHLSMTLETGGLERLLVEFGRGYDPAQFALCFLALEDLGPPADDLRLLGHGVTSIEMPGLSKWETVKTLRRLLVENKIDILHTHNTYPQFYGTLAAKWAGVPVVINTQHGRGCGPGWKSRVQFKIANRLTDRIVGVSQDAARICIDQDPAAKRKTISIWNGIDLERFQFHGPSDNLVAISVARLSPEKDFRTLLRALPSVLKKYPAFRLRLVGDGQERSGLESLAAELGIAHSVEFLGERKDIPDLLRTAGFYVSSSKTEGISLTLLEAMAVGLPIVTTRVGGNPEIVDEGVTGKLSPPRSPVTLSETIIEMIEERPFWADMGQAARARAEQHFDVRHMINNYQRLYHEIHTAKARRGWFGRTTSSQSH